MNEPRRLLVALNGSPVRGSSIQLMLEAVMAGADEAGGETELVHCDSLDVQPCVACGPEPTSGFCIFHDDMDRVYALLQRAHAIAVGSPVYFDAVSAQLKLVMDRCNCITPLQRDGTFRPKWRRTRRGIFVTASSAAHPHELAERSVRGFLKWVGARWEETLAWRHEDIEKGSVRGDTALMARARSVGKRLIESAPLEPSTA